MYKYLIILVAFIYSCSPKCEKVMKKARKLGCIKDSSYVNIKDSVVVRDSVSYVMKTKDSIIYIPKQEGSLEISAKPGSATAVTLGEGGWIKAVVVDSSLKISYYLPPRKEIYKEQYESLQSKYEELSKNQTVKVETKTETVVVKTPIPKIIKIFAIFGVISLIYFGFLIYKKIFINL